MPDKIRCCWCGWYGYPASLDLDENDEPKYCPICGHDEFDNRYFVNHVTTRWLKPTWNKKTDCEGCEW